MGIWQAICAVCGALKEAFGFAKVRAEQNNAAPVIAAKASGEAQRAADVTAANVEKAAQGDAKALESTREDLGE